MKRLLGLCKLLTILELNTRMLLYRVLVSNSVINHIVTCNFFWLSGGISNGDIEIGKMEETEMENLNFII